MLDRPTAALARFTADLRYDQIPASAREHARNLLMDAVGGMLAGHRGEETPKIAALARALGNSAESTVVGGEPLSLAGATLLNAFLTSAITAMDSYLPAAFHVTPETVPPALAIAERDHLPGRDLLVAVAVGCEVAVQIAAGLNYPAFRARGWHTPGVVGPFGGAAAAGKLLGLDADRQRQAFGLAGSQAAGTFAAWGTPTVKFHQCRGAVSGLLAALLAQQDFPSSDEFLTASDGGLYPTYSDGGSPDLLLADLGQRWELENISVRLWPTPHTHLVTALLDLLARDSLQPADVQQLDITVDPATHASFGVFASPRTRFEATNSLTFVAAVTLHRGSPWPDHFGPAFYDDPTLQHFLANRIRIIPDPTLSRSAVRLHLHTADGRDLTAQVDHARGTPHNPATRSDLTAKFHRCAHGRLPDATAGTVLEMLLNLEQVPDIAELMALLSQP